MTTEASINGTLVHEQLRELGFVPAAGPRALGHGDPYTRRMLMAFQRERELPVTGVADTATVAALAHAVSARRSSYPPEEPDCGVVRGTVRQAYGRTLPPLRVELFTKTLRREELLGAVAVCDDGSFHVTYPLAREVPKGAGTNGHSASGLDLFVRVLDAEGKKLFESDVLYHAPRIAQINVIVGSDRFWGQSDYELLLSAIGRRLDGAALADLTVDDVTFLAGDSGMAAEDIRTLVSAAAMAKQTQLPPQLFFALLKVAGPSSLDSMIAQGAAVLGTRLAAALDANVIAQEYRQGADELIARLVALRPAVALGLDPHAPTTLGSVLTMTGATVDQQKHLLEVLSANRDKPASEIWSAVAQDPALGVELAPKLQATLRLAVLTRGHMPLVKVLTQQGTTSIEKLATLTQAQWETLLRTNVDGQPVGAPSDTPGDTDESKITTYATTLARTLERSFPTAVLSARLAGDTSPATTAVRTFLAAHADFDFATTRVATYLASHPDAITGTPDTQKLVKAQLLSYERIRQLTTSVDELRALVTAGFTSAQRLAVAGVAGLQSRLGSGMSTERATALVSRAVDQSSLAIATYAAYAPVFHRAAMDGTRRALDPQPSGRPDNFAVTAPAGGPIDANLPTWESLFGSQDRCVCSDCTSIFSPGAYLVDVMNFVDKHATSPSGNALDQLLNGVAPIARRRPDLANIQITCDNTNTELPYVDLVNEVLENAVATPLGQVLATPLAGYQTTWKADELAAYPEHLNPVAYDSAHLAGAAYPWTLPFDLWIEEARTYLHQLGVDLVDVYRVASKVTLATPSAPDPDVTRTQLGFTAADYGIVTGANASSVPQFYGVTAYPVTAPAPATASGFRVDDLLQRTGLTYGELLEIGQSSYCAFKPQPSDPTATVLPCDLSAQQVVGDDLLFGGIHRVVRLWRKLGWAIRDVDIAMRALGAGSPAVTDLAPLLNSLAAVNRVNAALKLPNDRLMALWAPLDSMTWLAAGTDAVMSTYDGIFQNPATVHGVDPATNQPGPDPAFALSGGALPAGVGLSDHVPTILAALSMSQSELDALLASGRIARLAPAAGSSADYSLSLDNLSALHRYIALARSLGLAVADLLTLEQLCGLAFAPGDPSVTETFVANVRRATRSRLSIAQLAYVLGAPTGPVALDPTIVAKLLNGMVEDLYPIAQEGDTRGQAIEAVVRAELSEVLHPSQVDPAMAFLASAPTNADLGTFTLLLGALGISPVQVLGVADDNQRYVNVLGFLLRLKATRLIVQALGSAFRLDSRVTSELVMNVLQLNGAPAIGAFLALTGDGARGTYTNAAGAALTRIDRAMNFAWATPPFGSATSAFRVTWTAFVLAANSESYTFSVRATGGVRLTVNVGGVDQVLIDQLPSTGPSEFTAATTVDLQAAELHLLSLDFDPHGTAGEVHLFWQSPSTPKAIVPTARLFSDTTKDIIAAARGALVLLHKAGLLTSALRIHPDELSAVTNPGVWAGFDFSQLPLTAPPTTTPVPQFASVGRLVDLFVLRDRLPQAQARLMDVLRAATPADARLAFAGASNRSAADVADVASYFGLTAYNGEKDLTRLADVLDLADRVGVSAGKVLEWAAAESGGAAPKQKRAEDIRKAVKAKYDDRSWSQTAKTLRAPIREKQRDALSSWLIGNYPDRFAQPDDVYAFFLIDVQMCACQMTSRIVQATSTMQLFVQRILLQLEGDVSLPPDSATQWTNWRSTYRVWQANREIFAWPENYYDIGLRRDSTPFFKELIRELQQGELTTERVEATLVNYAKKLDGVSNLEIAAIHSAHSDSDQETLVTHIIGRTRAAPHVHWYRTRTISRGAVRWTPWEQVPLDINDDHLNAIFFHDRLWLIWPQYQKQRGDWPGNATPPDKDSQGNPSPKQPQWTIRLAWSEYSGGAWSPKRITVAPVFTAPVSDDVQDSADHVYETKIIPDPDLGDQLVVVLWPGIPYLFGLATAQLAAMNACQGEFEARAPTDLAEISDGGVHLPVRLDHDGNRWVEDGQNVGMVLPNNHVGSLSPLLPHPLKASDDRLYLPMPELGGTTVSLVDVPIFGRTPGTFQLVFDELSSVTTPTPPQTPFTYADGAGTFLAQLHQGAIYRELPWTQLTGITIDPTPSLKSAPAPPSPPATPSPTAGGSWTASGGGIIAGPPARPPQPQPKESRPALFGESEDYHLTLEKLFHPFACGVLAALDRKGADGLYDLAMLSPAPNTTWFETTYQPETNVDQPYPELVLDFGISSADDQAYSIYNWELFFHIPLLMAQRLAAQQQFQAAIRWLNYVFDPTVRGTDPGRFWNFPPLASAAKETIDTVLHRLENKDPTIQNAVAAWEQDPFDPSTVAETRPIAYAKVVIRQYLDTIIAWADQLFRQNAIEPINQAAQLYVIAERLVGPRPADLREQAVAAAQTFASLRGPSLDEFSEEAVALESWVGLAASEGGFGVTSAPPVGTTLAFCIPPNTELLKYWDTIADRLFKIRHCQDIQGNVQQLPLFQPPIDPALLVRAGAAGADIASALGSPYAPVPLYRFQVMVQKAVEFCNELKSLGAQLLAALEKRDAEQLSLLRSGQQLAMLDAVRDVKLKQLDEAVAMIDGLTLAQQIAAEKQSFYQHFPFMNDEERSHMALLSASGGAQAIGQELEAVAGFLRIIPESIFGFPDEEEMFGGANLGGFFEGAGRAMSAYAGLLGTQASLAQVMGGYHRRSDDRGLQLQIATTEVDEIGKQILAAQIRAAIAQKEIDNHDLSKQQEEDYDAFLRSKFTNADLFDQMASQLAGVYFQAYQVAYDLAKRAEKAFQFELASHKSFIQFGYWDSLKKGLLAGEQLSADLRRMEATYLSDNARDYEIAKHISLALAFPLEFLTLKKVGQVTIMLPESFFDFDYPGHFMRRLKAASITMPCVTGPYVGINATVTLVTSSVRTSPELRGNQYSRAQSSGALVADDRFVDNIVPRQSIVTSHGQADAGLFEASLRDERYLPFEGAGAIGTWLIELRQENNAFDIDSVTDVVLHLRYTARNGGQQLADAARTTVADLLASGWRVFSARTEFADAFYRFLHPANTTEPLVLELPMPPNRFPFQPSGKRATVQTLRVLIKVSQTTLALGNYQASGETLQAVVVAIVVAADGTRSVVNNGAPTLRDPSTPADGTPGAGWGWLDSGERGVPVDPSLSDTWGIQLAQGSLPTWLTTPAGAPDASAIEDVAIVVSYRAT
jgi:Tc toxin complex TcA C-terminal TcB-binding domain/ABC toxin N-terminal region/Neuraminidase-like domain/Putative peptidoglycan binding domain/PA14 domain/Salmonella virulence plasmid 28.1kDa A protein